MLSISHINKEKYKRKEMLGSQVLRSDSLSHAQQCSSVVLDAALLRGTGANSPRGAPPVPSIIMNVDVIMLFGLIMAGRPTPCVPWKARAPGFRSPVVFASGPDGNACTVKIYPLKGNILVVQCFVAGTVLFLAYASESMQCIPEAAHDGLRNPLHINCRHPQGTASICVRWCIVSTILSSRARGDSHVSVH
jgi:hypothetical protein